MPVQIEWVRPDGQVVKELTPAEREEFSSQLSRLLTPLAYNACLVEANQVAEAIRS